MGNTDQMKGGEPISQQDLFGQIHVPLQEPEISDVPSLTPEEPETSDVPSLTPNALLVLEKRYLKRDENGNVSETPREMFERVARNVAEADRAYDPEADITGMAQEFYNLMANLDFLPNSPTLMNAGRELQQLSACFVLPLGDSMEEIFDTVKNTAILHKSGGGTGFSFSRLRPRNDLVRSTKGVSSGPVSFMNVINAATEAVKQGGTRRGANMGMLRVDHPDILDFIQCKEKNDQLTNFNISVALTDEFMKALEEDRDYSLINPRNNKESECLRAREIYDLIVEKAWLNGEPGVIFIDRVNKYNPTPHIGQIESTNPCGEQPLLPYESCNLGSINLSRFVKGRHIDYDRLGKVVDTAVHFLDNVIDVNKLPIPMIETMTRANRKIGLGGMGFADLLIEMGMPYDSEEALKVAEKIMGFIQKRAFSASQALAEQRGPFPNFSGSIYDGDKKKPVRNACRTTIAPTGTISMIADCSSGIEPIFSVVYVKQVMDGNKLLYVNRHFEKVMKDRGLYSEELMRKISSAHSLSEVEEIPEDVARLFVTAHNISPEWHVKMQAAFQKFTDNAVSKTINFPNSATKDEVDSAFRISYEKGCKGITIYRDGSRAEQVLQKQKKEPPKEVEQPIRRKREPKDRPEVTVGRTVKVGTGCGNLYVTINEDEAGPFEVFASLGKAGGCAASQIEAISRVISLALRSGLEPEAIIKQLKGIRCPSPLWQKGGMILSCPDAIGKALEKYRTSHEAVSGEQGKHKAVSIEETPDHAGDTPRGNIVGTCPDCGSALEYIEGCALCKFCGYSKCG